MVYYLSLLGFEEPSDALPATEWDRAIEILQGAFPAPVGREQGVYDGYIAHFGWENPEEAAGFLRGYFPDGPKEACVVGVRSRDELPDRIYYVETSTDALNEDNTDEEGRRIVPKGWETMGGLVEED